MRRSRPLEIKKTWILLFFVIVSLLFPLQSFAAEQVFYFGTAVDAGLDTGYSEDNPIEESDPHFGWSLGSFYISGFTSVQRDDGDITFLKTADDTIALHFRLDQDINCLDGNNNLCISDDTDGYDELLGVKKSSNGFGRGTLIVRQTDYQNAQSQPQVYVDFLTGLSMGANTDIQLFEEGDYEVVLDYEVRQDNRLLGVIPALPTYQNYSIRFSFSVRNGNAMAFLFDAETGDELTNSSIAENGFVIDLARSRYLEINVQREMLSENGDELVEDVRYNGPARDGERYTEPGIYTITVTNPTTSQTTEKVICVGDDQVLRAYATTDYTIEEIQTLYAQGASISEEGDVQWSGEPQAEALNSEAIPNSPRSLLIFLLLALPVALFLTYSVLWKRRSVTAAQEESYSQNVEAHDSPIINESSSHNRSEDQ